MPKNGLHLITPTSVAKSGTTATINANGSVSFAACDSVSLNGVFSADYDNYQVVMWCDNDGSYSGTLKFRLRASGTDNSTSSSYVAQYVLVSGTSVNGYRQTSNGGELNYFGYAPTGMVVNFYGPYLAQPTAIRSITQGLDNTVSTPTMYDNAVTHNQSTAYDGFSFYTGYGPSTLTGRVAVYGMRK